MSKFLKQHANLDFLSSFLHSQFFVTPAVPTTPLTGRTYIVTGASAGLGLEAARHLVRLDAARVILAVRNPDKGEAARKSIEQQQQSDSGRAGVAEVWSLDLTSYESVKQFADRATRELDRLDGVLENAAVLLASGFKRAEGMEESVTVNVVSTFLLALLLLPKMKETAARYNVTPRLTIVSSEVHFLASLKNYLNENGSIFEALNDESKANMTQRYGITKLLEVLIMRELAMTLTSKTTTSTSSSPVIVNSLNPGFCLSDLDRNVTGPTRWAIYIMRKLTARTTEVGSRTLVAGLLADEDSHGEYMTDGHVAPASPYVRSKTGINDGKRVWHDLLVLLESIQPGISNNTNTNSNVQV